MQKDLQAHVIFGGGIGYELNNWFRFDVTARISHQGGVQGDRQLHQFLRRRRHLLRHHSGNFSSAVFMANAYLDLGTWWCLTPYIGAGLGGAYNRITGVQDNGINSDGTRRLRLYLEQFRRIGILPGMPRPASPTTSPTTSRSI